MPAPRVLFLTSHLPYPPVSGGRRREYELLCRLRGMDVTVCAISKTYEEDLAAADALGTHCAAVHVLPAVPLSSPVPTAPDTPFQILRHRCPAARSLIRELRPDLIHVEGFYLHQHVRREGAPVLLVEQNIEWTLWEQRAAQGSPGAFAEARRTRRAEVAAWRQATRIAAVTEADRTVIESTLGRPAGLVPDGVERTHRVSPVEVEPRTILFVGNFAYEPNVDAAVHLVADVFPLVRTAAPGARLLLVGNAPPPAVRSLAARDVVVTGRVPTIGPYLDRAAVVVCPLRVGGGVKVKMLEALASGKAIVTTSVGLQGLETVAGNAVVLADDPPRFAAGVSALLNDPGRRRLLEDRARAAAAALPTWDDAAAALSDEYLSLLDSGVADVTA